MSSESDLDKYFHCLDELSECDFDSCDPNLIKSLLDTFQDISYDSVVEANSRKQIFVNLFVEDFTDRKGPFKVPCVPTWTGRDTKEKLYQYFRFPVSSQTLLVNSKLVKDDATLFSLGLSKPDHDLCVFLKKTFQSEDMSAQGDTEKSDNDFASSATNVAGRPDFNQQLSANDSNASFSNIAGVPPASSLTLVSNTGDQIPD